MDFSSQAFVFIDFSASPTMPGVSRQLVSVKNVKIKDDRSTEVLTALGVQQGAGVREKQGGGTITMSSYQTVGTDPEVDWRARKGQWGTLTIQGEGKGRRESFLFRVSKVDSGNDSDGVHEDEIELVYTKRY